MQIILDYETTSSVNLKNAGPTKYAQDESTAILCVGYKIENQKGKIWIPERGEIPHDLWRAFQTHTIVAHNVSFERAITKYVLTRYHTLTPGQKRFFYSFPVNRWKDTAAMAAASSLPRSLEAACLALDLPIKKDMEGNRLMKKYMKPRKPSLHNPKTRWDDKNELRRIYKYCLVDLEAEYLLDKTLPDLSDDERAVWELDQKINSRGIKLDIPLIDKILKMISQEKLEVKKSVQRLSKGTIDSATQNVQVLKWINARLPEEQEFSNLRAPTIRDALLTDLPKSVRKMLMLRQSASKTSTSKYTTMLKVACSDSRARELLLYSGAVPTGRWAGMRLQPQNFPRPTGALIKLGFKSDEAIEIIKTSGLEGIRTRYGKHLVMDVLAACVRGMLIPSNECELFDGDWAAVEARLAFWFAEHEEGLKAFREGRKLYEEMAAVTFGCDIKWLLTKEGKESIERFVGKESILGCQYGMGWAKFLSQCHSKDMKMVTPEMAKKAVRTYREIHWPVPQAWKNLEKAIVAAITNPGSYHYTNKVKIYVKGKFLMIKLPSGRKLKYFQPRVSYKKLYNRMVPQIHYWTMDWYTTDEMNPLTGKHKRKRAFCETVAWGGIFFNHIVQGCARDFMVYSINNIENAGFKFLLSIHDEALAEAPKGKFTSEEFIKIMSKLPPWGKDAPLIADGWKGMRYRK